MILQFYNNNCEWAYVQADIIHVFPMNIEAEIRAYTHEAATQDSLDVILNNEELYINKEDLSKLKAQIDSHINNKTAYDSTVFDGEDYYVAPKISVVSLQYRDKPTMYVVCSRTAYLLNDNGKTINTIL